MIIKEGACEVEPVPLGKLLSSSETAALLEDLAKMISDPVRLWVVDAEGNLIACYPREDEGIEKEFAPIIEEVHQMTKMIHLPQGVAWPIVVEDRFLGVLVGEALGSDPSEPIPAFEYLGRMLTLLVTKEMEKRAIAQDTLEGNGQINLLYTLGETAGAYLDLGEIAKLVLQESGRIIKADKGAVILIDEATERLVVKASYGLGEGFQEEPLGRAVADEVARSGQAQIVNDPGRGVGPRSLLCAPLKTQDKVLGFISLADKKSGQIFTAADEKLLTTLAAQAAIAIQNAWLYEMTAQALAQRIEELSTTAEIVRELTAASLDLERFIDLMLDRAMQATGAEYGAVALRDEEKGGLLLLSQRGYPPGVLEPYRYELWPVERGIVGRVVKTGTVALVPDVSQDRDYTEVVEKVRSQLAVPIIREGEVAGVLCLESSEVAGFSERDAGFISHLAGHAAIAIENAQLYENITQRMRQAMVLQRVSSKLMRSLNVDQLLEEILEVLERSFGYLSSAVLLLDETTDELYIKASRGYLQEAGGRTRIKIEEGITGWVATHKVPLNVPDVAKDPRYVEGVKGTRSEVAVPMLSGQKVIGVLDVQSPRVDAFNEDDLRVLSSLAAHVTIAIEGAQLFQQVTEGRNKLQAILNSTRDGILMLDTAGQIVMVNPMIEQLWNLKRSEVVDLNLTQLVEEDPHGLLTKLGYTQEQMRDLLQQRQAGEQKVDKAAYEIATPGRRSFERVCAPVLDEGGGTIGQVIVLRDITEEKELERMREDLTRMIIHDLRSPLTSIMGGLHLLSGAIKNPTARVEMLLDLATSGSQKLLELVNSLLDISRLEAGKMRLTIKTVSLSDLVDGAREQIAPLAHKDGITLEIDLPSDLPQVAVDKDLMTRVLVNLLDNAIKFSPLGGAVRVKANGVNAPPTFEGGSDITSQHYISVSVTDTGSGIPGEYQEKIFEKFSQVGEQESRRGRGSGLGLAFCKLVVEAHGCRIGVESQRGQGSTFTFTLPVAGAESVNGDD
jgi:NtrC-family two-component system sensor histidine kinase KinB